MGPDFSELPDLVWVKILSFLQLRDRSVVSQTCQMLYSAFNHPSLWHTVSLNCQSCINTKAETIDMPGHCVHLIQKFGRYFKSLNLTYLNYLNINKSYSDSRHEILKLLGKECSLECLTLNVMVMISRKFVLRNAVELDGVISLINDSVKLKSLDVLSWPMYPNIKVPNLLEVIQSCTHLERLCLFWNSTSSSNWESINSLMPTVDDSLGAITMLTNLTTLKLRSSMINEELINELGNPKRVRLNTLHVLITYKRLDRDMHIPDISASAWSNMVQHSPRVAVHFTVQTRVPLEELCDFLKPGIPVLSIHFQKYSECKEAMMFHVLESYCLKLQNFVDYSFPSEPMDDAVIKLTSSCPELNHFIFNGRLHYDTAAYVAKLKGPGWLVFQVNSENIITTEPVREADSDVLIKRNEDGSVDIIRAPELLQSDIERQSILEVMIHEVSEFLGKVWLPMDIRDKQKDKTE